MYNIIYVGIDDTDSSEGMCTTYISAVVMDSLKDYGFKILGYPRLIRLNPIAQIKTRGNGAVSFKLLVNSDEEFEKAKNIIISQVKELSHLQEENTNPGMVFYKVETDDPEKEIKLPAELGEYALNTVQNMVAIREAEELATKLGAEIYKIKKGRGIIGALAAIGIPLPDSTYELLAYRLPVNYGTKRRIKYELYWYQSDRYC